MPPSIKDPGQTTAHLVGACPDGWILPAESLPAFLPCRLIKEGAAYRITPQCFVSGQ
jgi:hypothetical protein